MRIAWAGLLFAACSGAPNGQLVGGLGAPTAMIADADGIDFVDYGAGGSYIGRVPKSGGAVSMLVPQQAGPIATSGGEVIFATPAGAVSAIATGGGATRSIGTAETSPDAIVVDGADVFVGVDPVCIGGLPCPARQQLVQRFPLAGGAATSIYEVDAGQGHRVLGLVVDATNVSWVEDGALLQMPRGGGTGSMLDTKGGLQHIAEGGGYIYYATHTSLDRVPAAGGAPDHIADEPTPDVDQIAALAVDDRGVYWLAGDRLAFVPHAGGAKEVLVSGLVRAQALTADASGVYYATGTPGHDADAAPAADSGAIWRLAR